MGLAFLFRWFRALMRRGRGVHREDLADMGTAFGLDAIASLEPFDSALAAPAAGPLTHLERRSVGRFAP